MNKRLRNNLPLFFFVLMLISVSSGIYGQENHVSLLLKNVTLTRVLQDFSAETHIRLVYASSLTDSIRITAKTDDTPILALKKILRGTGFDFLRQSKDLWILVPKAATRKEPATLQGKVIDSTTQEPVPSATALLKYSQFGGTTDSTGFFTLENIPPGRYSLVVQRIGYVQFEQQLHFSGNDYFERLIRLQPSPCQCRKFPSRKRAITHRMKFALRNRAFLHGKWRFRRCSMRGMLLRSYTTCPVYPAAIPMIFSPTSRGEVPPKWPLKLTAYRYLFPPTATTGAVYLQHNCSKT
ncbi:MAG: carboxypeptidase-like regulatory domain-containing protein [Deferribacteres bacterium]|nr:carboxypeptidase-like regulatory domain-containing protein [Deferribacteres bacterium]